MKIKQLLALTLISLSVPAAIHAATVTRDVPVSGDINALVTSNSVDVIYTVAPGAVKVTVTGPDNIVPMVKVVTKGKTLNIGVQKPHDTKRLNLKGLKVHVSGPMLFAVKAYTSSDVKFTNALNVGNKPLKLHADTSADIDIPEISSTGTVSINADTSADIKITTLRADKLTVNADTSADVEIHTANVTTMNLEADTSADIKIGTAAVGIVGASADTSADIKIGNLTARILDASADTGADIKVSSGRIDKIKTKADTGGEINLKGVTITNIESMRTDTGGSVKTH